MQIRHLNVQDCESILPVMNEWWGGREMTHLLPRFLFDNFQETSFVVENEGRITGFLIGFYSQTHQDEAYIHLVGINPGDRRQGLASRLYEQFFNEVKKKGVKTVRCITSPGNKQSISYHQGIGFSIEPGDKLTDGIDVHSNYDGKGNERVLFVKKIS